MGGVKSGRGWSHEWTWAGSQAGVGETKGPDRNADWVCGLKTVPDAALIRSGSPVRCVFKRVNDKTLFVHWCSCMGASGGWSECVRVCAHTCIPHRVSTVFPYVSVSLTSCRKTVACVCARVRACGRFCSVRLCLDFSLMF